MDFLQSNCYRFTLNMYFLFAALPGKCPYFRLLPRLYFMTFITCSVFVQAAQLFVDNFQMISVTDSVPPTLTTFVALIEIILAFLNSDNNEKLIRMMEDDLKERRSEEEEVIARKYHEEVRMIILYFTIATIFCCALVFMSGFVPQILDIIIPLNKSRERILLFRAVYFIEYEKYFYVVLFLQDLGVTLVLFVLLAYHNMFMLTMQHVCYMFAIVGHRVENITRDLSELKIDYEGVLTRRLENCIKGHQRTLEFAMAVHSFADLVLFIILVDIIIVISLSLIELTDLQRIRPRTTFLTLGIICEFLILSLLGQKQIDESMLLLESVYNSQWYDCPVRIQKIIAIMSMRCCKPQEIVVNKLYTFSLRNFVSSMHMCISFYMVLKEV